MYKQVPVLILFHYINIHDTSKWEMNNLTIQQLALLQKNTIFILNICTVFPPNYKCPKSISSISHTAYFNSLKSPFCIILVDSRGFPVIPCWREPAPTPPRAEQLQDSPWRLPLRHGSLDSKNWLLDITDQGLTVVVYDYITVTGRKGDHSQEET